MSGMRSEKAIKGSRLLQTEGNAPKLRDALNNKRKKNKASDLDENRSSTSDELHRQILIWK